jgi:hypothetical protein
MGMGVHIIVKQTRIANFHKILYTIFKAPLEERCGERVKAKTNAF